MDAWQRRWGIFEDFLATWKNNLGLIVCGSGFHREISTKIQDKRMMNWAPSSRLSQKDYRVTTLSTWSTSHSPTFPTLSELENIEPFTYKRNSSQIRKTDRKSHRFIQPRGMPPPPQTQPDFSTTLYNSFNWSILRSTKQLECICRKKRFWIFAFWEMRGRGWNSYRRSRKTGICIVSTDMGCSRGHPDSNWSICSALPIRNIIRRRIISINWIAFCFFLFLCFRFFIPTSYLYDMRLLLISLLLKDNIDYYFNFSFSPS